MALVGAFFYTLIIQLPEEVGANFEGAPVAWLFFGQMVFYGLALAVLDALGSSRLSWISVVTILVAIAPIIFLAIFFGRRGITLNIVLILVVSIYFATKWVPPRALVIAAVVFGGLAIFAVPQYRGIVSHEDRVDWAAVKEIDLVSTYRGVLDRGGEVQNAVYIIQAADMMGDFGLGRITWNGIVQMLVPRQIVGEDTKKALKFEYASPLEVAYIMLGYVRDLKGTTMTGLSTTFAELWFFGGALYYVIAFILGRLFARGLAGDRLSQVLYAVIIVHGLHAITHSHTWFFGKALYAVIILVPLFVLIGKAKHSMPRQYI